MLSMQRGNESVSAALEPFSTVCRIFNMLRTQRFLAACSNTCDSFSQGLPNIRALAANIPPAQNVPLFSVGRQVATP